MPPNPPNLTELQLPPGWREFNRFIRPEAFRHIQKTATESDPPVNVVMDATNQNRIGWIRPWIGPPLRRQEVRVMDLAFPMDSLYEIWPELLARPDRLNGWLEEQLEGWARRERERQGLPPLPTD